MGAEFSGEYLSARDAENELEIEVFVIFALPRLDGNSSLMLLPRTDH